LPTVPFSRNEPAAKTGKINWGVGMDALFAAMMQDTALQKLQEYFNGKADENLAYGLSGSQKHVAFAAAFSRAPQPFVILVHNSEAVSEWREDLAALLPETEIVELPELDIVSVQAEARSMERSARRMDVLGRLMRKDPVIVLSTSAAAVQKGMSRNEFQRLSLSIRIGDELDREKAARSAGTAWL
jgi:transcription-repair coupling factor (superfamily II helicase)